MSLLALAASSVTANLDVLKEEVDRLEQQQQQAENGSCASYARVLRACSKAKALGEGKRLHTLILRSEEVKQEPFLWSHLVRMYLECGSLADARAVFDGMFQRDPIVWTYMVAAYIRQGHPREAIALFQLMLLEGVSPDRITLVTVLNACNNLLEGKLVHAVIVEEGFEREAIVGTAVVKMYGRCGSLEDAHLVFGSISHPDVVAWTTVLAAYAQNGHFKETLQLLEEMEREGVRPNKITFVTLLSSISGPEALEEGAEIHARIKEHGYETDLIVGNAIVNMYRKSRSLEGARKMFDKMPKRNLISWTALLGAYVEGSCYEEAFHLFEEMEIKGLRPDRVCLTTMLNACASPAALERGKMIHAAIIKDGFESSIVVGNALLNMYGKCGSLEDACRVFKSINQRNMVTWTTMIGAYVEHGSWKDALHLFQLVQLEGLVLSKVTYVTILNASSDLAFLAAGRLIHSCILEQGYEDTIVGTALINMYGKCGVVSDARKVFDKMAEKDLVAWNAMVAVCAQHGHESEALKLFQQMQQAGAKPDTITLVIVLFACSHAGLLEDGLLIFASMAEHGITPAVEHYGCVIDLLGRAGCLNEAENLIERMPLQPNAPVWRTLLGASRVHRDVDCGRRAAEQVLKLEPQNDAVHVVLSYIWSTE